MTVTERLNSFWLMFMRSVVNARKAAF